MQGEESVATAAVIWRGGQWCADADRWTGSCWLYRRLGIEHHLWWVWWVGLLLTAANVTPSAAAMTAETQNAVVTVVTVTVVVSLLWCKICHIRLLLLCRVAFICVGITMLHALRWCCQFCICPHLLRSLVSRNQARGVTCYHGGGMCYSHGVTSAVWVHHCCTAWSECEVGSRCYSCDVTCVKCVRGAVYFHHCCAVYLEKEPGRQCYMCYSSCVTFVTCNRCRVGPQLLCNVWQCYMCYSYDVTFVTCYRCCVGPQLLCDVVRECGTVWWQTAVCG